MGIIIIIMQSNSTKKLKIMDNKFLKLLSKISKIRIFRGIGLGELMLIFAIIFIGLKYFS